MSGPGAPIVRGGRIYLSGMGVLISKGNKGRLSDTEVTHSLGVGVSLMDAAAAEVANVVVRDCRSDGVAITSGAGPHVRDSTVRHNGGHGIVLRHARETRVEGNTISTNAGSGVEAADSTGELSANVVRGHPKIEIRVSGKTKLTVRDNVVGHEQGAVTSRKGTGVQVDGASCTPTLKNNRIFRKATGIRFGASSRATAIANRIVESGSVALAVDARAHAKILGDHRVRGGNRGLIVDGGGEAIMKGATVTSVRLGALLKLGSKATLQGNNFSEVRALAVDAGGGLVATGNVVSPPCPFGFAIRAGANVTLNENKVLGCRETGLYASSSSTRGCTLSMRGNTIKDCKASCVWLKGHASNPIAITAMQNTLQGCGSFGVRAQHVKGALGGNTVSGNKKGGVKLDHPHDVTLDKNSIGVGKGPGIHLVGDGEARVRENTVDGRQQGACVVIAGTMGVTLAGNEFKECALHGVDIRSGTRAVFNNNVISHNGRSGVVVAANAGGTFRGNKINNNGGAAFVARRGSSLVESRNELRRNQRALDRHRRARVKMRGNAK